MKIQFRLAETFNIAAEQLKNKVTSFYVVNTLIIIFQFVYILLRFNYLNVEIPFWFSRPWGDFQLAPKNYIYFIPITATVLTVIGLILIMLDKFHVRFLTEVIWYSVTLCNIFLGFTIVNLIRHASMPFPPLISPLYLNLLIPFVTAFVVTYVILPIFIDYAYKKKLVTNPFVHSHPGMVLKEPSARGGGFIFTLVFLVLSSLFVGLSSKHTGLYVSVFMVGLLGLIDDFQNTHPGSDFRLVENPLIRLFLLFISVLPVVFSGTLVEFVNNPLELGNVLELVTYQVNILGYQVPLLSGVFTAVWIVWLMNVLSWSNGIDGQYTGIVAIASIFIAILALRFVPIERIHTQTGILAAISAGIAFGFLKYTWHPSKIMWGFGAMSAGLVIAALSISARAKIVASILIILIPFLDAFVIVFRRIFQRKNPLSGDKGHLHHILLNNGWSVRKIAIFYWLATFCFGLIGLLSPERYVWQVGMIVGGVVAFILILLNLRSRQDTPTQQ